MTVATQEGTFDRQTFPLSGQGGNIVGEVA